MTYGWAAVAAALLIGTSAQAQSQESRPIALGETLNGELRIGDRKAEDNSLYDSFVFRGQAGQRVAITLQAADFDAYLQLFSGDRQLRTDDDGGGGANARINFTLPSTGEYVIWANGIGASDVGSYSLTLAQTQAQAATQAAATPIRIGQTVSGRLAAGDALADDDSLYDLYRFRGAAGDRVTVRLKSDDFDTYVGLHAAGESEELATNDDRGEDDTNSEVTFTLPAAGNYDIWANSLARDKTGTYELSLTRAAATAAGRAETLRFDRVVNGRLAEGDPKAGDDSYYDRYRFRGRADERVTITMSSKDFDSYLSLHRMGEVKELATNDDGPSGPDSVLVFTLPAAGNYDIWANSLGEGERGNYTLLLTRGGPATPTSRSPGEPARSVPAQDIVVGRAVGGRLDTGDAKADDGSYFDAYRFRAEAGRAYEISLKSGAFDTWLVLYADEATELDNDDDGGGGTDSQLSFTASRAGDFIVHANSVLSGATGDYVLEIRAK